MVDGASLFQSFLRVALPLVLPGLVATWIICLAFSWNEFLFGLSLTTKNAIPMPVIIAMSVGQALGTASLGAFGLVVFADYRRLRRAAGAGKRDGQSTST